MITALSVLVELLYYGSFYALGVAMFQCLHLAYGLNATTSLLCSIGFWVAYSGISIARELLQDRMKRS